MKILVLNGSPRPQGDTAKMVAVFRETAESAGHDVAVINVCRKNIKGSEIRELKQEVESKKAVLQKRRARFPKL